MSKNYKKNNEYILYALMYDGRPIYVGCTDNFIRRKLEHRKTKVFDYGIIIKKFKTKEDALIAENAIVRFMSLHDDFGYLNSKSSDMLEFKMLLECRKEHEVKNG